MQRAAAGAFGAALLARLRSDLPEDVPLLVGHGQPVTTGFLAWQDHYLATFEDALREADWSNPEAATAVKRH